MAKKPASEYFSFTRKERTGIIVIVLVILLLTGLPLLFPYLLPERKQVNPDFEKTISGLTIRQSDSPHTLPISSGFLKLPPLER